MNKDKKTFHVRSRRVPRESSGASASVKSTGGASAAEIAALKNEVVRISKMWREDADHPGTIYTPYNAYSEGGISALGRSPDLPDAEPGSGVELLTDWGDDPSGKALGAVLGAQMHGEIADVNAAAERAETKAASAKLTADSAQIAADTAKTAAVTAQATADSAKTAAATAQSDADDAMVAAEGAGIVADKAVADAATAQSTAQSAISATRDVLVKATDAENAAKTAQNTANTAGRAADKAQATADSAKTAAATAQTKASAAEATANAAAQSVSEVRAKLELVKTAAAAADKKATDAQASADDAQTSADNAGAVADIAKATADSAKTAAATAAKDATTALSAASTASSMASAAQNTAGAAGRAAATAQATADSAKTAAAAADKKATGASEMAGDAWELAIGNAGNIEYIKKTSLFERNLARGVHKGAIPLNAEPGAVYYNKGWAKIRLLQFQERTDPGENSRFDISEFHIPDGTPMQSVNGTIVSYAGGVLTMKNDYAPVLLLRVADLRPGLANAAFLHVPALGEPHEFRSHPQERYVPKPTDPELQRLFNSRVLPEHHKRWNGFDVQRRRRFIENRKYYGDDGPRIKLRKWVNASSLGHGVWRVRRRTTRGYVSAWVYVWVTRLGGEAKVKILG